MKRPYVQKRTFVDTRAEGDGLFSGTMRRRCAIARELLRRVYETHSAGCCLHLFADDFNTDDISVGFCMGVASEADHGVCLGLAKFFASLTRKQRTAFLRGPRR
jgi:hypothetical protein